MLQVKKVLYKTLVWLMYLACLPLLMIYTVVVIISSSIESKVKFGEFDFVDIVKALFAGYYLGHKQNMYNIEKIFDDSITVEDFLS